MGTSSRFHRWTVIALTVATTGVVVAGAFAARGWIVDRYYLLRLERSPAKDRWRWIETLVERKCAAVVPHLLQYEKEHPFDGSIFLPHLGARAQEAVPALLEVLGRDPVLSVAAAAARALDQLDPSRSFPLTMRLAHDGSNDDRRSAVFCLGSFGSRAPEVVPFLIQATNDPDEAVAQAAAEALGRLGRAASAAVPRLLTLCRDARREDLRFAGVASLAHIGVVSPDVLMTFEKLLPETAGDGNRRVARALVRLAAENPSVIEMLIRAIAGDRETKVGAILSLEWIGPPAFGAISALSKIAADGADEELARAAKRALQSIRP